jgi:ABC-type transport system involved in cytochrome bd biosynthesis fused ATPase/permease subunit
MYSHTYLLCHCYCYCSYGSKELTSVVGWVPQEPALLPMTVADNIAYGLQQHEVTRQDIEYAATEVHMYLPTVLSHSVLGSHLPTVYILIIAVV